MSAAPRTSKARIVRSVGLVPWRCQDGACNTLLGEVDEDGGYVRLCPKCRTLQYFGLEMLYCPSCNTYQGMQSRGSTISTVCPKCDKLLIGHSKVRK